MKTLGIVGGIGPESTIEYYRSILEGYRKRMTATPSPEQLCEGAASMPHLIIDSIDVNRGIAMLDANDLAALADYVAESVERLTRAGAEIALIAANTPHIVFDEVEQRATVPMISLVQATCERAVALGYKKLALLGTGFTMRGRFYPHVFARGGSSWSRRTKKRRISFTALTSASFSRMCSCPRRAIGLSRSSIGCAARTRSKRSFLPEQSYRCFFAARNPKACLLSTRR